MYLALERNMIDAAEFSSPAMNYAMRFDAVTKYSLQPGVHQPGLQCNLFFNLEAWKTLPEDPEVDRRYCRTRDSTLELHVGQQPQRRSHSQISRKHRNRHDG